MSELGLKAGLLLVLFLGAPPLHAQAADSISVETRAQIINELLLVRSVQIPDTISYGACEVFLALGQASNFRERLRPRVLERITGQVSESGCERKDREQANKAGWYFEGMQKLDPNTIVLRARVAVPEPFAYHFERYTFCRKDLRPHVGFVWNLYNIELSSYGFEAERSWRKENSCPPPGLRID